MAEDILTKRALAKYLGTSTRTVERKIEPSFWIGPRSPRYIVKDVLRQLKGRAA